MVRNFALPTVTLAQVLEGIKTWNVLPFMAASACCLILLLVKWVTFGDVLGGFALIAGCILCAVFFYFNLPDTSGKVDVERSAAHKLKNRIARQSALSVLMIALFYVSGNLREGYYFDYASGQTTLWRGFLPVSPFGSQQIFWVYRRQGRYVDVDVLTKDAIPLRCHVIANGILLDDRDPLKLGETIFNLDPAIQPQGQISTAIAGALASAAARVLSSKTSVEVGQQKQFLIPYSIGTPLGDIFQRYMLQWDNGDVSFSCQVRFGN